MMEHPSVVRWRKAVESKDTAAISAILAENVVLCSPIKHEPYSGQNAVITYLSGAFKAFINPSFRYINALSGVKSASLEFNVLIDGDLVDGIELITWSDNGKITEIKLFLRPLNVINKIHQSMNSKLKPQAVSSNKDK
jgi:hypothetical protein